MYEGPAVLTAATRVTVSRPPTRAVGGVSTPTARFVCRGQKTKREQDAVSRNPEGVRATDAKVARTPSGLRLTASSCCLFCLLVTSYLGARRRAPESWPRCRSRATAALR